MKKLALEISKAVAKLSLSTAHMGAGLASHLGFYQPKVPERIAK